LTFHRRIRNVSTLCCKNETILALEIVVAVQNMENATIMCPPGAVLYAEKLLLVVRANYIDRKMAPAAGQRLLLEEIPVIGGILN
jgi:hypothetical protein